MLILFIIQLNSVENKKCVKQATHVLHYYLTNCVASKPLLCGPRNYPNLPHKREFFLRPTPPPTPLEFPIKLHLAFKIPPNPRNFQSLLWGGGGRVWTFSGSKHLSSVHDISSSIYSLPYWNCTGDILCDFSGQELLNISTVRKIFKSGFGYCCSPIQSIAVRKDYINYT